MKKILLSLAALVGFTTMAHAEGTTLVMSSFYSISATATAPDSQTSGDYTIAVAKNSGSTAPSCNKAGDLRLYAKNTITISTTGDAMTSLVFTLSTQGKTQLATITADAGTVATQASGDTTVSWSGEATSVTFTVGDTNDFGSSTSKTAGQFDIDKIDINGGGEVPAVETVKVENIAAFLANPTTTDTYEFTNPVTVVYQYNTTTSSGYANNNLYIQDATGGLLVYGDINQTYNPGDVIPAGFTGKYTLYNGGAELTSGANFAAASGTAEVSATSYAVEDLSSEQNNLYVYVAGVEIVAGESDGSYTIKQDGSELGMYNKFGIEINADTNCNVWGVINYYEKDDTYSLQLYPIKIENASGETKLSAGLSFPEASYTVNLGESFTAPELTKATDAAVTYASSNEEVATVDASTGAVTVLAAGTTTISAVAEANDNYYGGSASYTLTVTNNVTVYKANTVADGKYAFWFENGVATPISESYTYGYCYLESVEVANDSFATDGANLFTFTSTDNGWTILDSTNRYLGMDATHSGSFNVYDSVDADGANCYWNISFDGDNAIIENTAREGYCIAYVAYTSGTTTKHEMVPVNSEKSTTYPVLYSATNAAGLNAVAVDANDAAVEYFNLQGMRVANPQGGIFIRRQGNKVSKVVIR
jgi:hypothetical protein